MTFLIDLLSYFIFMRSKHFVIRKGGMRTTSKWTAKISTINYIGELNIIYCFLSPEEKRKLHERIAGKNES